MSCYSQLLLLCYSLNLSISSVKLWTVEEPLDCYGEEGSWEFCIAAVGLCWVQDAPVHCLAEIQNLSSAMHLIASNICCDSEISQQYCPLTVTQVLSMRVTYCRMLCSLPRSCLVRTVKSFWQWRVVQLWPGDIFDVLYVFVAKTACSIQVKRCNFWVSCFPR